MNKAVSAYRCTMSVGDGMKEGDIVHLDAEKAQPLIDAGVLEEASEDDVNGTGGVTDDVEAADEAAITRSINDLSRKLENAVAKATEAAVQKAHKPSTLTVPATIAQPTFRCMGEMLLASMKAHKGDRRAVKQLEAHEQEMRIKSPLGSNEGTPSQGGYAVKPDWYNRIWDKVREYPKLLERTERIPISGDTLNIPLLSETSLADGQRHGGILAYWVGEGNPATASYPALNQVQAVVQTQVVLVYATNQLLQDSNIEAFDKFVSDKVGLEFVWQENVSVCSGAGTTQPVGILNQPSLITVTKSSLDTSKMFGFDDLSNMYRSLYPMSRANAVWLVNPEAYSTLIRQVFVTAGGTATTYPAFGGVSYNAADEFPMKIFGKPVVECLNLPELGLVGDIILADLSQLVTAEKPGMEAAISTEIQFTTLQTAFRFVRRYDIRSPWAAALTSVDGHYSYSPFVALQSRGT